MTMQLKAAIPLSGILMIMQENQEKESLILRTWLPEGAWREQLGDHVMWLRASDDGKTYDVIEREQAKRLEEAVLPLVEGFVRNGDATQEAV